MSALASSAPGSAAGAAAFDTVAWRDPVSGKPLEPIVLARTPAGVPICGALRVAGSSYAYPIVDCVARVTPELAHRHRAWLAPLGLEPVPLADASFQPEATVESFGFQWAWNQAMRSEADLRWRVAERFRVAPESFAGKTVLDAGAGAGDQSRWLLDRGARVVSIDLSSAIDVVAAKLRLSPNWVGVQGDITALPFADETLDVVYCEGVIQHTRDSALTVRELLRVLRRRGLILATHYFRPTRALSRAQLGLVTALRTRFSRLERFHLLFLTGVLAALAHVPVLGRLLSRSGVAIRYSLMPDFKTTWTNTFDCYGNHAFQRHVTSEEFWSYFASAGDVERVFSENTLVVARKRG